MPTALYYLHDPFAPDPNRPTRFGSACILIYNGSVLLEKRSDSFRWGIVTGDIHNTESFKDCAIRQTIKETGISLQHSDLSFLKIFDDPSRIVSFLDGNIYRMVHVAYVAEFETLPITTVGKGSMELRWVPLTDLEEYDLVVTHKEILEYYLQQLQEEN